MLAYEETPKEDKGLMHTPISDPKGHRPQVHNKHKDTSCIEHEKDLMIT